MKCILISLALVLPAWGVLGLVCATGVAFGPAVVALFVTMIVTSCASAWLVSGRRRTPQRRYRHLDGMTDLLISGDARSWFPDGVDPREGWVITPEGRLRADDGNTTYFATPSQHEHVHHGVPQ